MINEGLEQAVNTWNHVVEIEHPLFQLPVETIPRKNQKHHKGGALWMFATDMQKVMAYILDPKEVEKRMKKTARTMFADTYTDEVRNDKDLFTQMFNYHNSLSLLVHELFHPLYCPNSTWLRDGHGMFIRDRKGDKIPGDQQLVYQAIYAGLKAGLPSDPEADLVAKTKNLENAIWDFAIDTFQYFFLSNRHGIAKTISKKIKEERDQGNLDFVKELRKALPAGVPLEQMLQDIADELPEGIIPAFDVISYADEEKLPPGILALNRYTYSLLFCADKETRINMLVDFEEKLKKGGTQNIPARSQKSLKALVKYTDRNILAEKGISPSNYASQVDQIFTNKENDTYDNSVVVDTMTSLMMDTRTRYDAIKGFVESLADLVQVNQYEQRKGMGSGSGQATGMGSDGEPQPGQGDGQGDGKDGDEGQGNQPTDHAGNQEADSNIDQVLDAILQGMSQGQQAGMLGQMAQGTGSSRNPYLTDLQMQARDEYYKRKSPEIDIQSPDSEAHLMQMGKIKVWKPDYSLKVLSSDLHKHMPWINFGVKQNLPVLIELAQHLYKVTYFRQEEIDLETFDFQDTGLDLPRNWVLVYDGSSSMGGGAPGAGTAWDALCHVNYGLLKTMYKAAKIYDQEVDIGLAQFSNSTRISGPLPLFSFYENIGPEKNNLLACQNGGTSLDLNQLRKLQRRLKPGQTVWSFISDGEIYDYGSVEKFVTDLCGDSQTSVLYFDMFHSSRLGQALDRHQKTLRNLQYQSVRDMNQILTASLSVLIKYDR